MTTQISGDTGVSQWQTGSVSQDDLAANVAGNGPAFSAYQSVGQASSVAAAKVNFQTEQFDVTNNYDTALSRFQPSVAGYYQINAALAAGSAASAIAAYIFVNGFVEKAGTGASGPTMYSVGVSGLVYLNGTTDYVEIWGHSSVAQNWQNTKQGTYFQGFLARAA